MSKYLIALFALLFVVGCAHTEPASLLAQLDATAPDDQPDGGFILCKDAGRTCTHTKSASPLAQLDATGGFILCKDAGNIPRDTTGRIVKFLAEHKANTMSVRTIPAKMLYGKQWICIKYVPIPME